MTPKIPPEPWTNEMIAELRRLWPTGMPANAIGIRLGASRSAVLRKRKAIGLPLRSQLSTTAEQESRVKALRAGGMPYAKIGREVGLTEEVVRRVLGYRRDQGGPRHVPDDLPPLPPIVVHVPRPPPQKPLPVSLMPQWNPMPIQPPSECCWPIGEPGTRTFRFCDDGVSAGTPYCDEHRKIAYVKVRARDEVDA